MSTKVRLHSGNVIHSPSGVIYMNAQEELQKAIARAVKANGSEKFTEDGVTDYFSKLPSNPTDESTLCRNMSVKVFLQKWDRALVDDAVNIIRDEAGNSRLQSLIISVEEDKTNKEMWEYLNEKNQSGQIAEIGTCDINEPQLEEIQKMIQRYPDFVQHNKNLAFPKSLLAFCEKAGIKVTHHSDENCNISDEELTKIVNLKQSDGQKWTTKYLARYSTWIECRSILESKTFILLAEAV